MASNSVARVKNVTPKTRTESIVHALGLIIEVTGWTLIVVALLSVASTAALVVGALAIIWLGRKFRSR